jgi:hypothetical protein
MQNLINELSKGWRAERSLSQMTLGRFIEELEALPQNKEIENINEPHSYRGYYSDLSFEKGDGTQTVETLLNTCKECLGETYTGYKGGYFYMDTNTPLWIAEYGSCGVKIMEIIEGDVLSLSTQDDD